jgi:hypothetical protein
MLRRRLDRIENHTHAVLNQAEELASQAANAISNTERSLAQLVVQMSHLVLLMANTVRELNDGVSGEVEIGGEVFGKAVPVKADIRWRLNLLEGDEADVVAVP